MAGQYRQTLLINQWMFVTHRLWLSVNWPDIWPPIAQPFQHQPVLSLLFCNFCVILCDRLWEKIHVKHRAEIWNGGQDGRGASSFTSYILRVQSSDCCLCVCVLMRVFHRKRSFDGCGFRSGCPVVVCAVVTQLITQWSLTYTGVSMDIHAHMRMQMQMSTFFHTHTHVGSECDFFFFFFCNFLCGTSNSDIHPSSWDQKTMESTGHGCPTCLKPHTFLL